MPELELREIVTLGELKALQPAWSALWQRCPLATPFQSPEWLIPWWERFNPGELWSFALYRGDTLAGLAPLFLEAETRKLLPLGIGISDYLDLLLEPAHARAALRLIATHLQNRVSRWDYADLQDLHPRSPLRELEAAGLAIEAQDWKPCPVLRLPGTVADFHASLPKGLRRNLRRYAQQLREHTPVEFLTASGTDWPQALDEFFRLDEARWASRGREGAVAGELMQRFHREVACGFAQRGWLRLHSLACGGETRAVVYVFLCRGRAYSYLGAFDPELRRFSPGTLLIAYAIENAIAEGAVEYDFLRGDEPYKYGWGAQNRFNLRVTIRH